MFFCSMRYSISSSCSAAAIAARLSRIRGSSCDFLRHIQQEQWIFPLENRPVAPRAHARTFLHLRAGGGSFACDGLRACAAYDSNCGLCSMRSLLDCSGRLQESSRKHALLQAAYLPRRNNTVAHSFSPFSFILGIVSPAMRNSKFFAAGASILHMPI